MTIFWDAHHTDIDKKQEFELGTGMIEDGRMYRYYRAEKYHKGGELIGDEKKE